MKHFWKNIFSGIGSIIYLFPKKKNRKFGHHELFLSKDVDFFTITDDLNLSLHEIVDRALEIASRRSSANGWQSHLLFKHDLVAIQPHGNTYRFILINGEVEKSTIDGLLDSSSFSKVENP
ncbi:hypothetical protein [Bdellovibrio sp. BCCA]|uniref:hypothetical protein n=1 Tax=Bdellovibrio sp. BCCA TaxID=3136281 RepID=UPI0030F34377